MVATSATTPQSSLRAAISIVPQDTVLFNDTLGYNLPYGKPAARRWNCWRRFAPGSTTLLPDCPKGWTRPWAARAQALRRRKAEWRLRGRCSRIPAIPIFDEGWHLRSIRGVEKAIQAEIRAVNGVSALR